MLLYCLCKFFTGNIKGLIPGNLLEGLLLAGPVHGLFQTLGMPHDLVEKHTLHA